MEKYFAAVDLSAEVEEDSESTSPTAVKGKNYIKLYRSKLTHAYYNLSASRGLLWDELLRSLVEMLNLMSFNSAVKSDDYLAMAR